jgi:hypothetical protein
MSQRDYDDEYPAEPRRRRRDDEEDDEEPPRRRRSRRDEDDDYYDERRGGRQADLGDDLGMRMLLPVGRSGWAIAAGYLGLISVLCIPSPFALMAGLLAIRDIRRNPKKHGMGRATFGIAMGGIGTISLVIVLISVIFKNVK